jgi:hypothetical protein
MFAIHPPSPSVWQGARRVVTAVQASPSPPSLRSAGPTKIRARRIVDSFHERNHEFAHVPAFVEAALRALDCMGAHDMYDREALLRCLPAHGYGLAARWLEEHRHLYFVALNQARG